MDLRPHKLSLYNSWSRAKELFEPFEAGRVGIYVCGPTVYGDAHLGHAKSYISFDVLVRYLRHLGYRLRYVQNITDVGHLTDDADEGEDKLIKQARLDQVHPMEIAERYTRSYMRDMEALKVQHADIYPRATQHILEQIALVRDLVASGHAYVANGSVYFSVSSWPEYGRLAGRQGEVQKEGTRVEVRAEKRDPRDFALWKAAEEGHILRWESPWGWGYPGWHIECSVMSTKYLGPRFDIHGGGLENKFPHHECEIAQSHAHGDPFARFWLHNNMINVNGQKMGKSLGNFVTVKEALSRHTPEAIRFFILSTHYRAPANYTDQALQAGQQGVSRLATFLGALRTAVPLASPQASPRDEALRLLLDQADRAFHEAMDDDLNTPEALAALFDFVRRANPLLARKQEFSRPVLERALALFQSLGEGVLGLLPKEREGADAAPFIQILLDVRSALKEQKIWGLADGIRQQMGEAGIEIKDSKQGSTWSRRR